MKNKLLSSVSNGGEISIASAKALNRTEKEFEAKLTKILQGLPAFIGLPSPKNKCPYTSLSRTSLCELISPCERNAHKPPVKAIYRKSHKYATRGRWIIPTECLFRYLLSETENSIEVYLELASARRERKEAA